LAARAKKKEQL
jgi:hypothetical protein